MEFKLVLLLSIHLIFYLKISEACQADTDAPCNAAPAAGADSCAVNPMAAACTDCTPASTAKGKCVRCTPDENAPCKSAPPNDVADSCTAPPPFVPPAKCPTNADPPGPCDETVPANGCLLPDDPTCAPPAGPPPTGPDSDACLQCTSTSVAKGECKPVLACPSAIWNKSFNTGFNSGFNSGYNRGFNAGWDSFKNSQTTTTTVAPQCPRNQWNAAFNVGFNAGWSSAKSNCKK